MMAQTSNNLINLFVVPWDFPCTLPSMHSLRQVAWHYALWWSRSASLTTPWFRVYAARFEPKVSRGPKVISLKADIRRCNSFAHVAKWYSGFKTIEIPGWSLCSSGENFFIYMNASSVVAAGALKGPWTLGWSNKNGGRCSLWPFLSFSVEWTNVAFLNSKL